MLQTKKTSGPLYQKTLKNLIETTGVTLHSGEIATLVLRPAPVDTGIVFRRVDLNPPVNIPATALSVSETMLQTILAHNGAKIGTVEHLMSAFSGVGIDNAYVDVTAAEIPIMDGSAEPFVSLIQSAGIIEQDQLKKFIRIKREVKVQQGDKWASLEPYDGFKISFAIDFNHPMIQGKNQYAVVDFSKASSYIKEVSQARTFGFMSEYEQLKAMNLARGGSLENAIVLNESGILNEGGLRYEDEFVKHKILDAVGDLYLVGHSLIGAFSGHKAGHALNNLLLRELLADKTAWEYVTFEDASHAPCYQS